MSPQLGVHRRDARSKLQKLEANTDSLLRFAAGLWFLATLIFV